MKWWKVIIASLLPLLIPLQIYANGTDPNSHTPKNRFIGKVAANGVAPGRSAVNSAAANSAAADRTADKEIERAYQKAAGIFHSLKQSGRAGVAAWRKAAAGFQAIHRAHPRHARSADALYSAALSQREAFLAGGKAADLEKSVSWFRRFVRVFPSHRLADDSLMHVGIAFAQEYRDEQRAHRIFREIITSYPKGDQAKPAAKRIKALGAGGEAGIAANGAAEPAQKQQPAKIRATPATASMSSAGSLPPQSLLATIKRLDYWSLEGWTRVVLTTDDVVTYRYERLPKKGNLPARIYIDLEDTRLSPNLAAEQKVDDGVLKRIRVSRYDIRTVRVVFDLMEAGKFEVRNLNLPNEKKIFIDLYPASASTKGKPEQPAKPPRAKAQVSGHSLNQALGLKVGTVVIDPGHGGRDPGAVAFNLREKMVALDISLRLKEVFRRARPDIKVLLTREKDVFIPLEKRPAIAKSMGADLFISVHLNAHKQQRFNGIETYFLNLTTDASALRVAARENASTKKQVGNLNDILRDLLRDTNILESSKLANSLQNSLIAGLGGVTRVRDLGVKQAPFMVLIGAEMPGVLIEAGFLTNKRENRRLRDPKYLDQIAEGIYEGLRKYIQEQKMVLKAPTPPPVKTG